MDENEKNNVLPEEEVPAEEVKEEAVPAEETAPEAPEEAPAEEAPAQEPHTVEVTYASDEKKETAPKKSGKGGMIALIIAIVVVVIAIALILLSKFTTKKVEDAAAAGTDTAAAETAAADSSDSAAAADSSAATDSASSDTTSDAQAKYDIGYAKHDPSEVVLTINGTEVTWGEYYYWLSGVAYTLESSYGITDYSGIIQDDYTYNDYVHDYVASYVTQVELMIQWADEEGLGLTDEQKQELADQYQSDVDTYGGGDEAAFEEYLAGSYITPELYNKINEIYLLMQNVYTDHYGENADKITDEDAVAYAEEQGYMYCKHILISFDSEAEDADADKAEKLKEAQDILDQLKSSGLEGADLDELFTTLMNENSDDTGGLSSYPDGYMFASGTMVQEFEDATAALGEYELSDIVETSYGYHIILRLPITADTTAYGSTDTLRTDAADALFEEELSERMEAADLQYKDGFETLDLNALFTE